MLHLAQITGQWICLNLSPLPLFSLYLNPDLGKLNESSAWLNSTIQCKLCSGKIKTLSGIVCSNFGLSLRGCGSVCEGAWHGNCYTKNCKDAFPVFKYQDLDDSFILPQDDENLQEVDRYHVARDGDHLMTCFQCDTCHFWNIKRRAPTNSNEDTLLLLCIRRANLDSLWSRESSTVNYNRRQAVRYLNTCKIMGIDNPYPPRGPFPVQDSMGMITACAILIRSLDTGRNANNVQFSTIRKLRGHVSSFHHTVPNPLELNFTSEDSKSLCSTNSPTNSRWFCKFMMGCHKRMGDICIQNRPVTIDELHKCLSILRSRLDGESQLEPRLKTALTGFMLAVGFCAGLRGEDILKVDLGGMRSYWDEGINHPKFPHVPLILVGRFKGEKVGKIFVQPLSVCSNSGIDVRFWCYEGIITYDKLSVDSGPMFREDLKHAGKRAKMVDLDLALHEILKEVQDLHPEVITKSVDIEEEYSIFRSLRRGVTSHAQNVKIDKSIIEANNCWRKHARSNGMLPGMSMLERYSDAKASIPTLIRFSSQL